MSFADILKQEQQRLDESNGGGGEGVKYPKTKHQRLFFQKDQRELLLQVLPSAQMEQAPFAEPVRKIFLQTKTSQGKDLKVNFTLDPDPNPGSLLDQKVAEWAEKGMIPNGFGGQQSPRRIYLVNVVKIVQNPANPQQYVQERDEQGNLVVRLFELPQSAYANLIRKLQDPLLNVSGGQMSFMDINKPAPVKISKPAKGQMEYPVDVYTNVQLPPLGQGWENQLEDLKAHAVPTERLENGYEWVQAFVDMKEGRKPNQRNSQEQAPAQPAANPFAQQPQQPSAPQQPVAPQQPTQQPYDVGGGIVADSVDFGQPVAPQQPQPTMPQAPTMPEAPVAPQQQTPPAPQQPVAPQQPAAPAPNSTPTHNVELNDNGLMDIDSMLEKELGGDL